MTSLPLSTFKPAIKRKADYAFAIGPFIDLFICPEDLFILVEDGDPLMQFLNHPERIREELFFGSLVVGVAKDSVEALLFHQPTCFTPVGSYFDIKQRAQRFRRGHLGRCCGFYK